MKIIPVLIATAYVLAIQDTAIANINEPSVLDDTINVLVIKEPGVSQTFIDAQVGKLTSGWSQSWASQGIPEPVSLTIINPGAALQTPASIGGDVEIQRIAIKEIVEFPLGGEPSLRDVLAADVVLAFVDDVSGGCG